MKSVVLIIVNFDKMSLPVRGAWIEISQIQAKHQGNSVSLPVRGAWIEIGRSNHDHRYSVSLPVRGARIEILQRSLVVLVGFVAPCEGSED